MICENERVRTAKAVRNTGNPAALGELMFAAHASMRDDFEASCEEIDFPLEAAINIRG